MEAARLVARGERIEVVDEEGDETVYDEALLAEAEQMGIDPQSLIDAGLAQEPEAPFALLPENLEPFGLFMSLQTQWRWIASGMGKAVRVGLSYPSVESTLRMMRIRGARVAEVFADIRAMERSALEAWNG